MEISSPMSINYTTRNQLPCSPNEKAATKPVGY